MSPEDLAPNLRQVQRKLHGRRVSRDHFLGKSGMGFAHWNLQARESDRLFGRVISTTMTASASNPISGYLNIARRRNAPNQMAIGDIPDVAGLRSLVVEMGERDPGQMLAFRHLCLSR